MVYVTRKPAIQKPRDLLAGLVQVPRLTTRYTGTHTLRIETRLILAAHFTRLLLPLFQVRIHLGAML